MEFSSPIWTGPVHLVICGGGVSCTYCHSQVSPVWASLLYGLLLYMFSCMVVLYSGSWNFYGLKTESKFTDLELILSLQFLYVTHIQVYVQCVSLSARTFCTWVIYKNCKDKKQIKIHAYWSNLQPLWTVCIWSMFTNVESFMILERYGRDTNRGLEPYVFVCESSTVIANIEQ